MTNIIVFPQASFTVAAGSPILAAPPRQPFQEAEPLLAQAAASAKEFNDVLDSAAKTLKIQALHVAPKAESRFHEKARGDKGGNVDTVYDLLRGGLIATSAQQIRRALDFFAMDKNSRVVEMLNQFSHPDPESGMRRAKILLKLDNGHICEIQLRHEGMQDVYSTTHKLYQKARAISLAISDACRNRDSKIIGWLEKKCASLNKERISLHDRAARRLGLNTLEETQEFVTIGGAPFVIISHEKGEGAYALTPDFERGVYQRDNAGVIAHYAQQSTPSTREAFLKAAVNGVRTQAANAQQESPPALRLELA